jgi:hypothetical protein
MDELEVCIDNLLLSKPLERKLYESKFIELYGNPIDSSVKGIDNFYLNKCRDVMDELHDVRADFNTNKDFYYSVAVNFAQVYIPIMISEYGIVDDQLINVLFDIAAGKNIKVFSSNDEANDWIFSVSNGSLSSLNGDYGAFRFDNYICFTLDCSVSFDESIKIATYKLLASMIHETFHFLIDVTCKEHFVPSDLSLANSGGSNLNEGLVEMYSLDFSKKYDLIHFPALYYVNDVNMCRILKKLLGVDYFDFCTFSCKYDEIIPDELLYKYKVNERIRYFSRNGIAFDPNNIEFVDENEIKFL